MAFNILGLNHKTAPVALREKVAFSEDRLAAALRTLRQENGVAEAVRRAVRSAIAERWNKKPICHVQVLVV